MKEFFLQILPEMWQSESGEIFPIGKLVGLGIWIFMFLFLGLVVGAIYFRRGKLAADELERDNDKSSERLDIYRMTVEKQGRSMAPSGE